ncbi:hypothetical protein NI821_27465, partial [Escherichia coli]|uniref:hypothetical protein n=1 Tax=Escherichia coli TaxID=562 RepID=UPI00209A6ED0
VLNKTGPQSIHILRGVRQQQDEPGRFSICSRQAAVVLRICVFCAVLKFLHQIDFGYKFNEH